MSSGACSRCLTPSEDLERLEVSVFVGSGGGRQLTRLKLHQPICEGCRKKFRGLLRDFFGLENARERRHRLEREAANG